MQTLLYLCQLYAQQDMICVVENIRDVIGLERIQQFNGTDHVPGGVISPWTALAPTDRKLKHQSQGAKEETCRSDLRIKPDASRAIPSSIIFKKKSVRKHKVTTIEEGHCLPVENWSMQIPEMILARSLQNRLSIDSYVSSR